MKARPMSTQILGKAPDLRASTPELRRLEEAVVNFVHAEMMEGATRKDIEAYYKSDLGRPIVLSRTQGQELTALDSARLKVKYLMGENWRVFFDDYFEGAINALEFVKSNADKESEAA